MILFQWDGEAMKPLPRYVRQCDRDFVVGETYPLSLDYPRSSASHAHLFASVHDAWANLPESLKGQHPTAEHLRKWALIKAGYCDERDIVCATPSAAATAAGCLRDLDEYAVIVVRGNIVKFVQAKSQSVKAMPGGEFQKSKQAVLDVLAELIGVPASDLAANAGTAA